MKFEKSSSSGETKLFLTVSEVFHLIYKFLKERQIIREFVTCSYKYHKYRGLKESITKPFGEDNVKEIIFHNAANFGKSNYDYRRLSRIFVSFDGSFEWEVTPQGHEYWKEKLEKEWSHFLKKNFPGIEPNNIYVEKK